MRSDVARLFTEGILNAACRAHGLSDPEPLAHGDNYVFEAKHQQTPVILRLTHSLHRSLELIHAELDWVSALHDSGISVAPARTAPDGRQVIPVDDHHHGAFYAVCFERAAGNVSESDAVDLHERDLMFHWGRLLGQLHAHSRSFAPRVRPRPPWDAQDRPFIEQHLPDDPELRSRWQSLQQRLGALPRSAQHYGLIHGDLAMWNFACAGERLTAFDFDSCMYAWFAYDIVICLYYAMPGVDDDRVRGHAAEVFLPVFLQGYQSANTVQPTWFQWLPDFLLLQTFYLTAQVYSFEEEERSTPQMQRFLSLFRARVMGERPVVPLSHIKWPPVQPSQ